jgi:hypothetical protein
MIGRTHWVSAGGWRGPGWFSAAPRRDESDDCQQKQRGAD